MVVVAPSGVGAPAPIEMRPTSVAVLAVTAAGSKPAARAEVQVAPESVLFQMSPTLPVMPGAVQLVPLLPARPGGFSPGQA